MLRQLVMTPAQWDEIRTNLLQDHREAGMYALLGRVRSPGRERYLVRELIPLSDDDYAIRRPDQIVVKPSRINRIIARCEREDLGVMLLHSHPFDDGRVWFSHVDDWGEARELGVFSSCSTSNWPLLSLVLGQKTVKARAWQFADRKPPHVEAIHEIVLVGEHLRKVPTVDAIPHEPTKTAECHARQVLALGSAGQARIAAVTMAIVGSGGTGSVCAEMAARLGFGRILLIDDDSLEESNLSRVYGSTKADLGRKKVAILKSWIERISDAKVEAFDKPIHVDPSPLAAADVILCCTDTQVSRVVCNKAAYQYMVPLIDMGNAIRAPNGPIQSASAQYTLAGPGLSCLDCYGMIDYARVRAETMSRAEYERLRKEGYVFGLGEPTPSVITLNTLIAGHAMTRVLDLVAYVGGPTAPKMTYDYLEGELRQAYTDPLPRCTCGYNLGRGQSRPLMTR